MGEYREINLLCRGKYLKSPPCLVCSHHLAQVLAKVMVLLFSDIGIYGRNI
ncbi:hypothetical protein DSOL_4602 [Desulfosporosinus metallidurans]|uniref:Uncharacterized protein n=1 Tax=Desulfosporosinus metallidurans TaxID=1888891 RepID=A0A1Q8QJ19_9FIRM|nr:hypothetical protein DSOL_4602 [Desulfosporosinus metallidurans]